MGAGGGVTIAKNTAPLTAICGAATWKPSFISERAYPSYLRKIFYRAVRPPQKILQISEVRKFATVPQMKIKIFHIPTNCMHFSGKSVPQIKSNLG